MSAQIKACFNGCSFTWGEGYSLTDRELYVYDRIVSKYFKFDSSNIAMKGSSNHVIFMRTANALLSGQFKIHFVQWSALNRIWLSPGPNTYFFTNDNKYPDYRYRDLYISKSKKSNLHNLLLLLNHDYQNICDLVDYCKILNNIAKQTDTLIFHINGLVPWTDDLTKPLSSDLSSSLSNYTKDMLEFETRDDEEIIKYFNQLQNKFKELDQSNWINLFDSMLNNSIDRAPEGHHPGIKSQQWMANQIILHLTERKII